MVSGFPGPGRDNIIVLLAIILLPEKVHPIQEIRYTEIIIHSSISSWAMSLMSKELLSGYIPQRVSIPDLAKSLGKEINSLQVQQNQTNRLD